MNKILGKRVIEYIDGPAYNPNGPHHMTRVVYQKNGKYYISECGIKYGREVVLKENDMFFANLTWCPIHSTTIEEFLNYIKGK